MQNRVVDAQYQESQLSYFKYKVSYPGFDSS